MQVSTDIKEQLMMILVVTVLLMLVLVQITLSVLVEQMVEHIEILLLHPHLEIAMKDGLKKPPPQYVPEWMLV